MKVFIDRACNPCLYNTPEPEHRQWCRGTGCCWAPSCSTVSHARRVNHMQNELNCKTNNNWLKLSQVLQSTSRSKVEVCRCRDHYACMHNQRLVSTAQTGKHLRVVYSVVLGITTITSPALDTAALCLSSWPASDLPFSSNFNQSAYAA